MTTDPTQVREQIEALLAAEDPDQDVDALAARLEEAHNVLVRALESVDMRPGKDR